MKVETIADFIRAFLFSILTFAGAFSGTQLILSARPSRVDSDATSYQYEMAFLQRDYQELQRTFDLAVVFRFDPVIVKIVQHYSKVYVDSSDIKYQLIRTPDQMSYYMLSLIYAESLGKARAVSKAKAYGLMQILLPTAKMYQPDVTKEDLFNPDINIRIGFAHFDMLLEKYEGNFALALYAYNRGGGRVDKLIAYGRSPVNSYGFLVYTASQRAIRGRL